MKFLWALLMMLSSQISLAKVTVGSDPYPPFIYSENNKFKGTLVDYLPLVLDIPSTEITYRLIPWKRVLADAQKGQLDLVGPLLVTEERKEYLIFTEPIFKGNISLWIYRHNPKTKELQKETFAAGTSAKFDNLIFGQILGYSFNDSPQSHYNPKKVRKVEVLTVEQGIKMLKSGRIDIFLVFDPVVEHFISDLKLNQTDFMPLTGASQEVNYVMGISKKSPLAKKIDQINKRISEVSNQQILKK
ncbi:substrate-binding periplasmic protein [Bdellovibrio sp. HCB274]|uniref:substrate-binding periplasmic protein n=1 Tax=Bdellovibrio sp. HCB274 TaxID=3394361 RepID=UPI0039B6631C